MADNVTTQTTLVATIPTNTTIATDDFGGAHYQRVKLVDGTAESATAIAAGGGTEAGALRVTVASDSTGVLSVDDNGGSLTVDGTFWQATQPVSGSVSVTGNVEVVNDVGNPLPVSGPLTDAQLRLTAVPVSGTFFQGTQPVSGPLTDAQLRATSVPVSLSGTNAVTQTPSAASGGLTTKHHVSAASTNATNVKASAGRVYSITAFNLNQSPRYLKFHNNAGTPTAGSGVVRTVLIPGNTSGGGVVISDTNGFEFTAGIAFTLVTGIADNDAVAVAVSEIVLDIGYI